MATFDLDSMLATMARPKTRAQALRDGDLVDCSRAAAWLGFRVAAAMTTAAWEEVVGAHGPRATLQERADAGKRLRSVWQGAAKAVATYRNAGVVLPSIRFTHPAATRPSQLVRLLLAAGVDNGRPYVTLSLEGEA